MSSENHWNAIYEERGSSEVTWFQRRPELSLRLIRQLDLSKNAPIIDIGGGASNLVDFLLKDGFENLSVLDLSEVAISLSKERLGIDSNKVTWISGDITKTDLQKKYDLWHDRAVFHFLTELSAQESYANQLNNALNVGSFFVVSTFAEDGPKKCSGLEIVRYSKEELVSKFSKTFECVAFEKETHISPKGNEQKFNYWVFKKIF